MNILKTAVNQMSDGNAETGGEDEEGGAAEAATAKAEGATANTANTASTEEEKKTVCTNPDCTRSRPNTTSENKCVCQQQTKPQNSEAASVAGAGGDSKSAPKKTEEGSASQVQQPDAASKCELPQ